MLYTNYKIRVPGAPDDAVLTAYCPDLSPEIDLGLHRQAVLICPGGGYEFTSDREAEPVALAFLARNYNVFILRYHCAPVHYPVPQLEAAAALALIRDKAEETHTDPNRVFIMGFSAGGHLAGCLGILWNQEGWAQSLGVADEKIRPTGMVLLYPVITSGRYAHQGSMDNLMGERRKELNEALSLEKRVTPETVPAILFHSYDDDTVPLENSLLLSDALRRKGIPFKMQVYSHAVHGFSLANEMVAGPGKEYCVVPECQAWPDLADQWMRSIP